MSSIGDDARTKSIAEKSRLAREGEGYFEKERGYDRRVYENTAGNYLFIIAIFCVYYSVLGIYWWGILELGTCKAEDCFMF